MLLPILAHAQFEPTRMIITDGLSDYQLKSRIETNISQFLSACNEAVMNGKRPNVNKYLDQEGREAFNEIWKASPISCTAANIEEICLTTPNGYQVRNIPVYIVAATDHGKREEITIDFTDSGLINDISFTIDANMYKEIMEEHESVEDLYRRQVIVDFVENYRTAYNRKDLNYIESVFSNNALIITGKVIHEMQKSDNVLRSLGTERVIYQKQSKSEYIEKLKGIFNRNEYLNIIFEDVEVIQHPKLTDIYGVTLKQKWNASRYSDVGFLFLMIDFHDELKPLIQVRTWQPEKDKRGKVIMTRDEVFNLGDFEIVRSLALK